MTDEQIIDEIIRREGGFVNIKEDRGNATNFGITQATLAAWRGHEVSAADVEQMEEKEARDIYRERYIVDPGLHLIADQKLRGLLVDMAVNHGPRNAVKMLQRVVNTPDDGVLGQKTIERIGHFTPGQMFARLCAERVKFYGRIISHDHSQAKFASGWLNRAAEFIQEAG